MARIINAQKISESLERFSRKAIKSLPKLCLVSAAIGDDFSAGVYRSSQERLANELGIEYRPINLLSDISFETFKEKITDLNKDNTVTGIILNRPFPSGWQEEEVFCLLDVDKDVEGMHPANLGKLFLLSEPDMIPIISPTVRSVLDLLNLALVSKQGDAVLKGQKVAIIGFSSLIGRPLAVILGSSLATVSITHIETYRKGDLPEYVKNADIVISAAGIPRLIKGEWIKEGAIVIDVGMGKEDGKLTGDVDFETAKERAAVITPVPGGVGKLTTMWLFKNLVILAENKKN